MIEVKNILEDIVENLINEMEEIKENNFKDAQKKEIMAYTLNRIKPIYITSNKGFTHIINKYKNDSQFIADIMITIYDGLKIIKKTRKEGQYFFKPDKNKYYYTFPKIYGKVITKSLYFLEKGKITLLICNQCLDKKDNYTICNMLYESWNNPIELNKDDEGIYVFAPAPLVAQSDKEEKTFYFAIKIEKNSNSYTYYFTYNSVPVILQDLEIHFSENVLQIEDIYVPFE